MSEEQKPPDDPYRRLQESAKAKSFETVGHGSYAADDPYKMERHVDALQCEGGCVVRVTEVLLYVGLYPYLGASACLPCGPPTPENYTFFMPGANLNDVRKAFFED